MDLSFTDEQRAIADLAAQVFGTGDRDDLNERIAEAGLADLLRVESGLGMVETMLVLEAQGRTAARAPLWMQALGLGLLDRFAPGAGEPRVTIALDDGLSAKRTGGKWRVDGRLAAVAFAGQSELLIASGEVDGTRRLLLPPLSGAVVAEGEFTDGTPVTELTFDGVVFDDFLPVTALEWLEPRAVACIAALQLGVADEALKRTAAYVSERHQFGRPIGSFQAVMVRAADGYADVEALRAMVWRLCAALDAGTATTGDVEVAKIWAADAGHRVAHTAQHLHGGLGADLDYPLHRFYLRARALEMTLGGSLAHRAALGDWLAEIAEPDRLFVDA